LVACCWKGGEGWQVENQKANLKKHSLVSPLNLPHTTSKPFSASGEKTTCCPGVYAADECAKSQNIMLAWSHHPTPYPILPPSLRIFHRSCHIHMYICMYTVPCTPPYFSFVLRNIRAGGMSWQVLSFRLLTAHIWLTSFILPCLFNDIFITLINVKYLNFGSPSKRKPKQTSSVK